MICLVGIDGSGKTTHAKRLAQELRNSGKKCKYRYFREPFFLSFSFMAICRILNFTDVLTSFEGNKFSVHKFQKEPISLLWPWIRLIDLMLLIVPLIYVPIWKGVHIICDRFIYDILIDTIIDVQDPMLYKKLVGILMLRLIPRFSKVVLLDISVSAASKRKNEPFYLMDLRRRMYKIITKDFKAPVVNTNLPFNVAHNDLIHALFLNK